MLDREVLVSSAPEDGWEPDPDVGGEMNILCRTGSGRGRAVAIPRAGRPGPMDAAGARDLYVLESAARIEIERSDALEVSAGDMATIPQGAATTWHLTTPFTDFYVLGSVAFRNASRPG